jgi:ketosteroid isomerase-like protein
MSEENVEVVRRGYEALNRGDFDGMVADFAPTFEYVATGAIPGFASVYRGQRIGEGDSQAGPRPSKLSE